MKNLKVILIVFLAGCGLVLGLYLYGFWHSYDGQIPYPYRFSEEAPLPDEDLEGFLVVITGDRLAKNLERYIPSLSQVLSQELKTPLKIGGMARSNEGIHRTLRRLKNLKVFPKLVIYHGGSEEYFEKKFFVQEEDKILTNFRRYNDDKFKTLVMALPSLSNYLYKRVKRIVLKDLKKDETEYSDPIKQRQMLIGHQLFEIELEELIQFVTSKNSNLILFTIPLNLDVLPQKVCQNSTNEEIMVLQDRVFDLYQSGDYKSAYEEVQKLKILTPGNSLTSFLLGQILKGLGNFAEARPHLSMATALDCSTWRGTAIHNSIIRKLSQKYDIPLFDFDEFINQNMGRNVLFMDDIFPQDFYYEEAVKIFAQRIKKILDL